MRSIICLLSISFLLLAVPTTAHGAAQPPQDEAVRAVHAELERLDQELQRLLVRAGRNAADGRTVPHLADEAERLQSHLAALEAEVHRLGAEELLPKAGQLRALLDNLTRAADRPSEAARPAYSDRWPRALAGAAPGSLADPSSLVPANDACPAAPTIGFGTFSGTTNQATLDGEASCGSSLFTPDVWFRFVAPQSGTVHVDTFGSSYDTVVSVHTDCPGTIAGELACNDDAFGLQSATSFYAYSGQQRWIRVSGVNGATGDYQLEVGEGGSVSGTVKDAVSGDAVRYCDVDSYDKDGYFVDSAWVGSDGRYSFSGLAPATYFFRLAGCGGYLGELYDDIPCYGGSCDPVTGTPVVLSHGSIFDGVDFTLDPGGWIAGTVTDASTGDPISGAYIQIQDESGSSAGYDYTDTNGEYGVGGLVPGNYYAIASSSSYHNEVYDNLPCSTCNATTGTPIPVAVGVTTAGVDFTLTRFAAVTGTITDAATGDPISWADVYLYNDSGSYYAYASTAADGTYDIGGLSAGTYFVTANRYLYVGEIYDDLPCPEGYPCNPTSGTPVSVTTDSTTSGVDFALTRLGGLTGTVTRSSNGTPLSNARVELFTDTGVYWGYDYSNYMGIYWFDVLPDGNYFAVAEPYSYSTPENLIAELYDGVLCPGGALGGCDPTTDGAPIAVALGGTTTADFSLETGGSLSGIVVEAVSGDPVSGALVKAWDSGGAQIGSATTGSSGTYQVIQLPGGTFYATVEHNAYGGEIYPDLPCPDGGCDSTSGTPIAVTLGVETAGVDFALTRKGSINGTVTESLTGDGIQNVRVRVYDDLGSQVTYVQTDANGFYSVGGLADGTYYLATSNHSGYRHEVYDEVACVGSCQPTTGTPVAVSFGVTTSGIDFALDSLGRISGAFTDSISGLPVSAYVDIYDDKGSWVDYGYGFGSYTFYALQPGTYYLLAYDDYEYATEIYQELACGYGPCDPTSGTPVVVALNQEVSGIDFTLDRFGSITGIVTDEAGQPLRSAYIRAYDATDSIRAASNADSNGLFSLTELLPGTYYVTASKSGYLGELYDGVPCLSGTTSGCTPSKGTPVVVLLATTVRHVNFALQATGGDGGGDTVGIRGTVTDEFGQPLANVVVDLWNEIGEWWGSTITASDGTYRLYLYYGTWYVSTDNPYGRVDQVYDGVFCPRGPAFAGLCDPTQGTPVPVPSFGLVEGVDFALDFGQIFTDGFESGDVSAWTSAVGGGP